LHACTTNGFVDEGYARAASQQAKVSKTSVVSLGEEVACIACVLTRNKSYGKRFRHALLHVWGSGNVEASAVELEASTEEKVNDRRG
jgi:hypothetical protein